MKDLLTIWSIVIDIDKELRFSEYENYTDLYISIRDDMPRLKSDGKDKIYFDEYGYSGTKRIIAIVRKGDLSLIHPVLQSADFRLSQKGQPYWEPSMFDKGETS